MKFGILLNWLKIVKELSINEFLRPSTTQMAMSNDIRLELLLKVLLRKMMLTMKRPFN